MTQNDQIQICRWAECDDDGGLIVPGGPRKIQMQKSDGTGEPLLKLGVFGADVIRFGAGEGVRNHSHPGSHMLFVIKGIGIVEYCGIEHQLQPGFCYLIPPSTDHAIRAGSELVLLAIGDDHRPLASVERMALYQPTEAG